MPKLAINGVDYNVEVSGQGPPLVALHGFTGSVATWESLAQAIGGEHTVVRVDLLGHGASSRPADPRRYSLERTNADLAGVLDALGLSTASWLGYSLGGRIALSLALAAPERCGALVLESASPGIQDPAERARRAASDERLADWIEVEGVEAFVEHWESLRHTGPATEGGAEDAAHPAPAERPRGLGQQPSWRRGRSPACTPRKARGAEGARLLHRGRRGRCLRRGRQGHGRRCSRRPGRDCPPGWACRPPGAARDVSADRARFLRCSRAGASPSYVERHTATLNRPSHLQRPCRTDAPPPYPAPRLAPAHQTL